MRTFVYNMAGVEHGNVTNEEFMEEVARYESEIARISKSVWKAPSSCLHKYFSNPKPMFPSVLRLTLSSL